MADNNIRSELRVAWLSFTKGVQVLLVPQPDDRPLDQYLAFRDAVLALVQDESFLGELDNAWAPYTDNPYEMKIGRALILELQASSRALEVTQATGKPEEAKSWWRRMVSWASTTTGSVKDLVDGLPHAKFVLSLFSELIDLFKGKD